jgi:glycosyltransferase involved in cell wall biosynthesis
MKLGIVTISYNQAQYLEQAIESVQLKDSRSLSYVIVDPGSRDKSRDIISKHKHSFSHILLEPDKGPADGLNKGFLKLANVDILGYLNSDDVYAPGALDYVISFFAQNPHIDVLTGAIRIINHENCFRLRGRISDSFSLRNYAMSICTICQQATFFRRSAYEKVGKFNISNKTCWDGELMVDMAIAGCRFATTRRVLGFFRIYETSITGSQRMKHQYSKDQQRIRKKIIDSGVRVPSLLLEKGYQLSYKTNIWRHLQYLLVRE